MVDYLVLDHLSNLKRATYTIVRVSGHVITNYCKVLVMSGVFPQFALRDFKIQRRGRQRERQKKQTNKNKNKNKRFYKQNNNFARASYFSVHFFACLVPRRLSFDENLRAKEGGKEATGKTRFACRLYLSHGPLRFITSHSRFALASAMRKTKRVRRRLFLCRCCTTTTRKSPVSRFMEDVNKQRRNFISLSEHGYQLLEIQLQEGSTGYIQFDKVSG